MTPAQFQRLLEKFSRGQCTPEEERFIIDWYERVGHDADQPRISEELSETGTRIWANIDPGRTSRRIWPLVLRAAVITIPILVLGLLYFGRITKQPSEGPITEKVFATGQGESVYKNTGSVALRVPLEDGSVVVLEPSSELLVAADFGTSKRQVRLTGAGFFVVKRDAARPFVVYANEVVTRVLGTSFHIRAYENDKEVTVAVKTGKVSVYANNTRTSRQVMQSGEVILTPNQKMTYHRVREIISKTIVEEPEILVPDSELFKMQFENAAVAEILELLSRNYGVEIRYDEAVLENCRLTTAMSDEGLYERIEVICKAIGASYSIDDDATITINSDGC